MTDKIQHCIWASTHFSLLVCHSPSGDRSKQRWIQRLIWTVLSHHTCTTTPLPHHYTHHHTPTMPPHTSPLHYSYHHTPTMPPHASPHCHIHNLTTLNLLHTTTTMMLHTPPLGESAAPMCSSLAALHMVPNLNSFRFFLQFIIF